MRPLVTQLQQQFRHMAHDMHILVVDDHSPDLTAAAVRMLQQDYNNLHLLEGSKAGLGAAYVRGMRHAIDHLQADVIFEMDADLSHDPADVPRLMAAIDAGADLVIGSRYVKGGSISADWGWLRRLNSRAGNLAARYIAGIVGVNDCTAGFRAISVELLQRIDLDRLRVQGYVFQVVLLHAAVVNGARVKEIPVDFADREHGLSKLGVRDLLEFAMNVWWIRLLSARVLVKFLLVGAVGVLVNLGCFSLFLQLGVNKFIASPLAVEISIISNFLLNNFWTFRRRVSTDRKRIKGLKFHAVSLLSLGVSFATFVLLAVLLPDHSPQLYQLAGIIPAAAVNYLLNAYWTFKAAPQLPADISSAPEPGYGIRLPNPRG